MAIWQFSQYFDLNPAYANTRTAVKTFKAIFYSCSQLLIFTGRNEVVAKVMFLLVSVILLTRGGVCLSACWDTTPRSRHAPGSRHPPPRSRHRHTVNERPVRILLECILVVKTIAVPPMNRKLP